MRPEGFLNPDGSFHPVGNKVIKPSHAQSPSFSEQLDRLQRLKTEHQDIWQDKVEIEVKTQGLPFMLMLLSDLHIGGSGVDYDALKKHLDFIGQHPVYTVFIGDLIDGFMPAKHPSGMIEDLAGVSEQAKVVREIFKSYEDKILAVVSGGQHDYWLDEAGGFDIYQYLTEGLNIPLLKSGGELRLKVDNQDYRIRLFHQIARYNSSFNYTHAQKQAIRLSGEPIDMVVSGDKHLGAVEKTHLNDREIMVAQLGTFKTEDRYGERKGYPQKPRVFFPVFLFSGEQKNIEVIENMDEAKKMIEGLQLYYRQLAVATLNNKSGS